MVHSVRLASQQSDLFALSIDFKNAFNTISRKGMLSSLQHYGFDGFVPFVDSLYGPEHHKLVFGTDAERH